MKEILIAISILSLKLGEPNPNLSETQIKNQWLGFKPEKTENILKAEKRLNIKLPEDYTSFIQITNGFSASNSIEPSFMKIEEIDYLKNIDKETIEAYKIPELENSILIAGKDEEQYFLLIPPKNENEKWKYWKFANWYPGEHEFQNLNFYFSDVLKFMEKEYKEKK